MRLSVEYESSNVKYVLPCEDDRCIVVSSYQFGVNEELRLRMGNVFESRIG